MGSMVASQGYRQRRVLFESVLAFDATRWDYSSARTGSRKGVVVLRRAGPELRRSVLLTCHAIALVAIPLTVVPSQTHGFALPRYSALAALALASTVLFLPDSHRLFARGPLFRWLVGLGVSQIAVLAIATTLADESWLAAHGTGSRFLGGIALAASVALALSLAGSLVSLRHLVNGILLLNSVLCALAFYSLAQWIGLDPLGLDGTFGVRPVATLGNPNFVGAVLALSTPITIWMLLRKRGPWWLVSVALALNVVALLAAEARLGWLAAITGAFVTIVLLRLPHGARRFGWLISALPLVAPLMGFAAVWFGASLGDPTGLARVAYWRAAFRMIVSHPWTGVGPGRFRSHHWEYRPVDAVMEAGQDVLVDSSHAWFLDAAATVGLPFAVLWLGLLALAGIALHLAWKHRVDDIGLLPVLAGMITAHGVQSSISVPIIVTVWLGWLLMAATICLPTLLGTASDSPSPRNRSDLSGRRLQRGARARDLDLLVIGTAMMALVVASPPFIAMQASSRALQAGNQSLELGRFTLALEVLDVAARSTPRWPEVWQQYARTALLAGELDLALSAINAALGADQRDVDTLRLGIVIVSAADDLESAGPWFDQLLKHDPFGLDSHLAYAAWAIEMGDDSAARQALETAALNLDPALPQWDGYQEILNEIGPE